MVFRVRLKIRILDNILLIEIMNFDLYFQFFSKNSQKKRGFKAPLNEKIINPNICEDFYF